jgi:diaminopimelate epimerase
MPAGPLRLSKHHAAGNDFLVLIDLADARRLSDAEVRALCDRHLGVGADGILRLLGATDDAAFEMELRNADGSSAEMSGNGIRCLVQAAVDAGVVPEGAVAVKTLAGLRKVDYETLSPGLGYATVDMGPAVLGPELDMDEPADVQRARSVDMGNPHIVLLCAPASDEVVKTVGGRLEKSVPGGANVEFAWRAVDTDVLNVRVFERGVGETLACGTGACAAAAAARSWAMVGSRVEVRLPGGTLDVQIADDSVVLSGPTRRVAEVVVRESDLAALVLEMVGGDQPRQPASPGEVVRLR